jgi:hypothetical protein
MRFFGKKVLFSRSRTLPSPEPGSFFLTGEDVSGAKEILSGVISFLYAEEMEMIKRSSL